MRKPAFCICENKDADQLRGSREADQRLCFRYTDSTNPLLPKSEISSLQPCSVAVQPGLCRTWSETPKTGFLRTRLIFDKHILGPDWGISTLKWLNCISCVSKFHRCNYLKKRILLPALVIYLKKSRSNSINIDDTCIRKE